MVAAATTSLPETIGGVRNWDYRYCWLRDATLTLQALLGAGYIDEARAWREWLLRAVAGDPPDLKIMYGIHGERRLPEYELPWLRGYEGSSPGGGGDGGGGAAAGGGGRAAGPEDHVRHPRRAPPARVRAAVAARLRGLGRGAGGERGGEPVPARRLGNGARRAEPRPRGGPGAV